VEILAHRGLWSRKDEQNTPFALTAALAAGHGIETDLRDQGDAIVVAHDAFSDGALTFDQMLQLPGMGMLALNIKADGLATRIARQMDADTIARSFFFDMSVPDMQPYLMRNLPVFTRVSDVEPNPAYYAAAQGLWLDAMEGPWRYDDAQLEAWLADGKQLAIVSEELHGRPHQEQWRRLTQFGHRPGIYLCTDLVADAQALLASV